MKRQQSDDSSCSDEEFVIMPTKKRSYEDIKAAQYLAEIQKFKPEPIVLDDLTIEQSQEYECNVLQFGQSIFHANYKKTFVTRMKDFTIISNFNLNAYTSYIEKKIKPQMKDRWIHSFHVGPTTQELITRKMLQAREDDGQIVAYHYKEFSMEGNECVYFGYIPSTNITFSSGSHVRSVITVNQVWPRQLFVRLVKTTACECSAQCIRVSVELFSQSTDTRPSALKTVFCVKRIPWKDIYLMMGDTIEDSGELYKKNRVCNVCAQCIKCSLMSTFCNAHR